MRTIIILFTVIILIGCGSRSSEKLKIEDISEIICSVDSSSLEDSVEKILASSYGKDIAYNFFNINPDTNININPIIDYRNDSTIKIIGEIYRSINYNNEFKKLEAGFNRLADLTKEPIPLVVLFNSGLNRTDLIGEDYIGVDIDMYLGESCYIYKQLNIPKYVRRSLVPSQIPYNVIERWCANRFTLNKDNKFPLLDKMILSGKLAYISKITIPESNDADIMNYSDADIIWCKEYESAIWDYIVDNKFLFSTKNKIAKEFTDPGPYTEAISQDSPPRIGEWIGLRIIEEFQKEHKLSIKDLLERSPTEIMRNSRYNP